MKTKEPERRSAFGWEMAFAWCPHEDSPLLGELRERRDDTDTSRNDTAEASTAGTSRRWQITRWPYS